MKHLFAVFFMASVVFCQAIPAAVEGAKPAELPRPAKVKKGRKYEEITLTGRIVSKHVKFRRGRSVRGYFLVGKDGRKVPLPNNYRVDADGETHGVDLKKMTNMDVTLVCQGRTKVAGKKVTGIFIKKIVSVSRVKLQKPLSLMERIKQQQAPAEKEQ